MRLLAVAAAVLVSLGIAFAQGAPTTISFVARLADNGTPVTGNHDFVFSLYDQPTAGNVVWKETYSQLAVPLDGVLYLDLGQFVPLDSTVFDGKARYLEISFDGTASDTRVLIESVPYAIRAGRAAAADNADNVGGRAASFFQRAVQGGCTPPQVMQSIDPVTGLVTCATPSGSGGGGTYTAGTGLSLAGGQFSINTAQTQARVSGVCSSGAMSSIDVTGASPTCLTAAKGISYLSGTNQFGADFSTVQARLVGSGCASGAMVSSVDVNGNATCITPGSTLTVTTGTLNVDTTTLQTRVTGTCGVGATIVAISSTGSVTCDGPYTPVAATVNTAQTTVSTTYADLTTVGPSVTLTVPASGAVMVTLTAAVTPTNNNSAFVGLAIDGTVPANDNQALAMTSTFGQSTATYRVTTTAGSHTFKAVYRVTGGAAATFAARNIVVTPLAN